MSRPIIESFEQFWPFYLGEHRHPLNRLLHTTGTSIGIAVVIASLATGTWAWIFAGFVAGYGLAWIGHFFVEGNKPASFSYPLWSFRGDFRMLWRTLTGRLRSDLAQLTPAGEGK